MPFAATLFMALVVAIILTAVFLLVLGWRRPAREPVWGTAVFFFLLVWLGTWALAGWMPPAGPVLWDVPWLLFLLVGLIIALVIAASAPPRNLRAPTAAAVAATPTEAEEEEAVSVAFGVFFWILLVVLIVTLIGRYALQ